MVQNWWAIGKMYPRENLSCRVKYRNWYVKIFINDKMSMTTLRILLNANSAAETNAFERHPQIFAIIVHAILRYDLLKFVTQGISFLKATTKDTIVTPSIWRYPCDAIFYFIMHHCAYFTFKFKMGPAVTPSYSPFHCLFCRLGDGIAYSIYCNIILLHHTQWIFISLNRLSSATTTAMDIDNNSRPGHHP